MKTTVLPSFFATLFGFFILAFTPFAYAEPADVGAIQLDLESNGISLSWSAVTPSGENTIDHYRVYVDTHAVGDSEEYAEVLDTVDATTSYTLSSFNGAALVDTVTYYFSVTAVDNIGAESVNYSQEASIVFLKGSETIADAEGESESIVSDAQDEPVLEGSEEVAVETSPEPVVAEEVSLESNDDQSVVAEAAEDATADLGFDTGETLHEAASAEDTKAPEDVTDLRASYRLNNSEEDYTVKLNWVESENSDNDLDYYSYGQKKGVGDYSSAIHMEKDKTSYQAILPGGERYTFKISSVDTNGNESAGAITSIILPATGPGLLLGFAGLLSLGATRALRRKGKE